MRGVLGAGVNIYTYIYIHIIIQPIFMVGYVPKNLTIVTILECSHESSLMICPWCLCEEFEFGEGYDKMKFQLASLRKVVNGWMANVGMR